MTGTVEGQQSKRSDKSAEHSSPWQLAKQVAAEATCSVTRHRAIAVDDNTVVDYYLLADR